MFWDFSALKEQPATTKEEQPKTVTPTTPKKRKCDTEEPSSGVKRRRQAYEKKAAIGKDEPEHVKACKDAGCIMCKWIRNRKAWCSKLTFLPPDCEVTENDIDPKYKALCEGSWLQPGKDTDGKFTLRCGPCGISMGTDPTSIQICNFLRHQHAQAHKNAVLNLIGAEVGPTGMPTAGAPSEIDFKVAWDMASKGHAPHENLDGIAERKKIHRMWFCLYEAMAEKDRLFLERATISLARDERHFKLFIRYAATDEGLALRRGQTQVIRFDATSGSCSSTPVHGRSPQHRVRLGIPSIGCASGSPWGSQGGEVVVSILPSCFHRYAMAGAEMPWIGRESVRGHNGCDMQIRDSALWSPCQEPRR